jgi:hypothetical protein
VRLLTPNEDQAVINRCDCKTACSGFSKTAPVRASGKLENIFRILFYKFTFAEYIGSRSASAAQANRQNGEGREEQL